MDFIIKFVVVARCCGKIGRIIDKRNFLIAFPQTPISPIPPEITPQII